MSGDNSDNFGYAFLPQTHDVLSSQCRAAAKPADPLHTARKGRKEKGAILSSDVLFLLLSYRWLIRAAGHPFPIDSCDASLLKAILLCVYALRG